VDHDFEGPPFPARDQARWRYTLIPMYRLKPTPEGWERDRSPEYLVGLRTEGGKRVERLAKGRYRLAGKGPAVLLTSDHPDAV
jgi:hypothetical protein